MNDTRNTDTTTTERHIYRAWLRLTTGGVLGLPYPAPNEERARYLAERAQECFNGVLLDVEYMGEWTQE